MNAKKAVDTIIRDLRSWCSDPHQDDRVVWERELKKSNRQLNAQTRASGAMYMSFWGNWHGNHGLGKVLNGDQSGWDQLELSFRYRWWKLRIDTTADLVADVALLLTHALAMGSREQIEWLYQYQYRSFKTNTPPLWDYSKLGLFSLELSAISLGTVEQIAVLRKLPHSPGLGPYAAVIQYWNDNQKLAEALPGILDYHLKQALTDDEGYPEFVMSSYELLPIEYLALRRVRADLNLDTPTTNHPLLRPELIKPPASWGQPIAAADPEVQTFIENVSKQQSV